MKYSGLSYLPEEFSGDFLSLFLKQNQTVGSLTDTLKILSILSSREVQYGL